MRSAPLLPLLSVLAMLIGCTPASEKDLASSLAEQPANTQDKPLLIPVETAVGERYRPALLLEARNSSGESVLLQQVPALLSNPGNAMGRGFAALVSRGAGAARWTVSEAGEADTPFSFEESKQGILTIREREGVVFAYRFGRQEPRGIAPDRYRSTYIHPILDPFGTSLTDDFPEDHLHHRGLSWMWPTVVIEGRQHDLWHIRGVYQKFERWLSRETGPVCATVGVKNTWETADRTVADEWVWVRTFPAGPVGRAIDISLTWQARESLLIRGEEIKGYGGLCFRLSPREGTTITTPSGRLPEDSDLQPYPWTDQSGRFGERQETSGVAIFQHPSNLSFPAGWCLRHYGFLGVSWPGREPFRLEPGLPISLRFRIWIHRGDALAGAVPDAYSGFVDPPRIALES